MLRFMVMVTLVLGFGSLANAGRVKTLECRTCIEECAAASGTEKAKVCKRCENKVVCNPQACAKCMAPCQANGRGKRDLCDLGCPKVCTGFKGVCEANGRGPMPLPGKPAPTCYLSLTKESCQLAQCMWFSKGECYGVNRNAESAGCYKIRNQEGCIKSELGCGWDSKTAEEDGGGESKAGT